MRPVLGSPRRPRRQSTTHSNWLCRRFRLQGPSADIVSTPPSSAKVAATSVGGNDREIDSLEHEPRPIAKSLHAIGAGFVVAAALMLDHESCAERSPRDRWLHALSATGLEVVAFAGWGAAVRAMFDGQQWWQGLPVLARRVFLPVIESLFPKTRPVEPAQPAKSEPASALPVGPDRTEPARRCDQRDTLTLRRVSGTWIFGP